MNVQNTQSDSNQKDPDFKLQYFQIRHKAKLCVALISVFQIINRILLLIMNPQITPQQIINWTISMPLVLLMIIIIAIEHILIKKRGPVVAKYSTIVDITLLALFIADWIINVVSGLNWLQTRDPPCFKITSVSVFTGYSWRTLLVTLIVENWFLKIIGPVAAVSVTAGYTIYYEDGNTASLLIRALVQMFSVVVIIYCENKVKWGIIWITVQQEKWMQVNNYILDNIPENIMVLDLKGEMKFMSDYCKSFMEKFKISSLEYRSFFGKIQDLQKQFEAESPPPSSRSNSLQIERQTTVNELLTEVNERKPGDGNGICKAETLEDLIENFKKMITRKKLKERQFVVYNGKLRVERVEEVEGAEEAENQQKQIQMQERSIEVKISFIQHAENYFIILIVRDTTQRDLLVTMEETNKYKDQLLASVSHELRAPLNGNINLVENAIDSSEIPKKIKEGLLTPALRSSKFLLHLINDILDMSQIKEKKLRLVFQDGNLTETLKNTALLVELQAKKKSIELVTELDHGLPRCFCTDHVRLSQIVLNLLNNGIKFTKEGAVKLIVKPTLESPEWVKINVEDSGIGMSQENVKKLFSSYTHIEFKERQAMNPTGVGLGLNIAYNLAALLAPKGQEGIHVSSIPGQGSTFSFIIENKGALLNEPNNSDMKSMSGEIADEFDGIIKPIFFSKKQKIDPSTLLIPSAMKAVESDGNNDDVQGCSCPKVLIVDDNPFNTMAFETILGSLEVKCESVYNGSCAIKQLLSYKNKSCGQDCKLYCVVFMDQEMPEMSGAETVREIRRLQGENLILSGIKVFGCTAHHSKEEVERFMEAGIDGCIHKPISKITINEILKDIL